MISRALFVCVLVLAWLRLGYATADQAELLWPSALVSDNNWVPTLAASEIKALDEMHHDDDRNYIQSFDDAGVDTLIFQLSDIFSSGAISTFDSMRASFRVSEHSTGSAVFQIDFDTAGTWINGSNISVSGTSPAAGTYLLGGSWTVAKANSCRIRIRCSRLEILRIYKFNVQAYHNRTSSNPSVSWSSLPSTVRGLYPSTINVSITPGSGIVDSIRLDSKQSGSSQWLLEGGWAPMGRYWRYTEWVDSNWFANATETIGIRWFPKAYGNSCSVRVIVNSYDGSAVSVTERNLADTVYGILNVASVTTAVIDSIFDDVFLDSVNATANQDGGSLVRTGHQTVNLVYRGMYKKTGVSATDDSVQLFIKARVNNTTAGGMLFRIGTVSESWAETQATWNNRVTGTAWTTAGGSYSTPMYYMGASDSGASNLTYVYFPVALVGDSVSAILVPLSLMASTDLLDLVNYETGTTVEAAYVPVLMKSYNAAAVTDRGNYRSRAADVGWRSKAGQVGAR